MGIRTKRLSCHIQDGVIKQAFEDDGGKYGDTDAGKMKEYLEGI